MKFLIKNIRPVLPGEAEPGQPVDIFIENGVVQKIGNSLEINGLDSFDSNGCCISAGFMDIGAQICDPGFEHRENLESASRAAIAGGFTTVACLPNIDPVADSKSQILYLKNKSRSLPVNFLPVGALSHGAAGQDMAELFDMHAAGAVAFSDGDRPVQDAGLLLRSMQYVQAFGGLILDQPLNKSIASGGQMHEGKMSTMLGLRGIPALAEEMMILRNLELVKYADGRLHFSNISTAASVGLIRKAKQNGLKTSSSVTVLNLCFTDESLEEFDSNLKVSPPLRSENDRLELWKGLADGTIDFISSGHTPWDEEGKNLEFPYAKFGIIGLETTFAAARTFGINKLTINQLVEKLTVGPRRILGLPVPKFGVGEPAEFTLFQPDEAWVFSEKDIFSKSKNTPFVGQKFRGRVVGVFSKGNFYSPAHP